MTDATLGHRTDDLDRYMWRHIAHHLVEGGRANDLRDLLLDPRWLQRKLEATDVGALLGDFDHLPAHEPVGEVAAAIRLSAHVVGGDPTQLLGQLLGRLGDSDVPEVQRLVERIRAQPGPALLRPRRASLTPPGAGQLATLLGHTGAVHGIAISADGRTALSGGADGTLRVWELETGTTVATLSADGGDVLDVAMSDDATRAVSVSADGALKVWDLAAATEMATLTDAHAGADPDRGTRRLAVGVDPNPRVAMSRSGRRVLSSAGTTLTVWDLATGTSTTFTSHPFDLTGVAIDAGETRAAATDVFGTITVWDLGLGAEVGRFVGHTLSARALAITGDGTRVVGEGADGSLVVWDVATDEVTATLVGGAGSSNAVAITPDGARAVSADANGSVTVWDVRNGKAVATRAGRAHAIAMSADGTRAVSADDDTVTVWDLTAGGIGPAAGTAAPVNAVAIAADGTRAVSAGDDGTLVVWDAGAGTVNGTRSGHTDVPAGREATFRVVDTEYGTFTAGTEATATMVFGVAITPDGSRAVTGGAHGTVRVWDLDRTAPAATLAGHEGSVWAVAMAASGSRAASAGEDGTVRVWDLATRSAVVLRRRGLLRRLTTKLRDETDAVNAVAMSADGSRVVSGGDDHLLNVWDVATRKAIATLGGHTGPIRGVAITPDGAWAVSASADRTVKVWDLARRALAGTLVGHRASVRGVAITADGSRAVSASADRTVRVWDLATMANMVVFTAEAEIETVAVDADGSSIVAGDRRGVVHHLELTSPGDPR